jgi:diguanylate cyclase (GGDEF)-like protein
MNAQLEKNILKNKLYLFEKEYSTVHYVINESINISKEISSRTMLRKKLWEYKKGYITLEDLRKYTQPKYEDGGKVLGNVILAMRTSDKTIIVKYGNNKFANLIDFGNVNNLEYEFVIEGNYVILKVSSPITENNTIVGKDEVLFDFTKYIDKSKIISAEEAKNIEKSCSLISKNNNGTLYDDGKSIIYINPLSKLCYMVLKDTKNNIYSNITIIKKRMLISWILEYFILYLLVYIFILKPSNLKITKLQESTDKYRSSLLTDSLTGAYSRYFLEQLKKDNRGRNINYLLVLTDVDNFKKINDTYGHLIGDEILKAVTKIFITSTRKDDFVVRFGGDEFLILLNNMSEKNATELMERIEKQMGEISIIEDKTSISYGIAHLDSMRKFDEILKKADSIMYANKKSKKSQKSST